MVHGSQNVHRLITYNKKELLKTDIDLTTKLRKNTKNDFEKDFYKLLNNSVFGETLENAQKCRNIKLLSNDKIN